MDSPTICFIILVLLSLLYPPNQAMLFGKCNECNEFGFACSGADTFFYCDRPETHYTCGTEKLCSNVREKCVPKLNNEPICWKGRSNDTSNCGTCEFTRGLFACIDERSYAFCCGSMVPNMNLVYQCPGNQFCNLEDIVICTPDWVLEDPSCPLPYIPSTTESAIATISVDNAFPLGALSNRIKRTT